MSIVIPISSEIMTEIKRGLISGNPLHLAAMKEILYIQAGTFANHVGTHFWNTQEAYFTYTDEEDPFVRHDTSFREGINARASFIYVRYRHSANTFDRENLHTAHDY